MAFHSGGTTTTSKLKSLGNHLFHHSQQQQQRSQPSSDESQTQGDLSLSSLAISSEDPPSSPAPADSFPLKKKSSRPLTSSSRDSVMSAASGAYFSAQEDDDAGEEEEDDKEGGQQHTADVEEDHEADVTARPPIAKGSSFFDVVSSSSSEGKIETPNGGSSSRAAAHAPASPTAASAARAARGGTNEEDTVTPTLQHQQQPTTTQHQHQQRLAPSPFLSSAFSSPPGSSGSSSSKDRNPSALTTPSSPVTPSSASRKSGKSSKSRRKRKVATPPSPVVTPRRGSLAKPTSEFPLAGSASSHPYSFRADPSSTSQSMHSGDLSTGSPSLSNVGLALGSPISASTPLPNDTQSTARRGHTPQSSTSSSLHFLSAPDSFNNGKLSSHTHSVSSSAPVSPSASSFGSPAVRTATGSVVSRPTPTIVEETSSVEQRLLQRWILSFATVNFDLEKGPDLESLWPPLSISKEEKDNIAFSSFPDTSIFDEGDTHFSFRIREVPLDASVASPPKIGTSAFPTPMPTSPPPGSVSSSGLRSPSTLPSRKGREASNASSNGSVRSLFARAGAVGSGASSSERNSQLDAAVTAELQKAAASPRGPGQEEQEVMHSDASSASSVDVTSTDRFRTADTGFNDAADLPRSASFNTIATGRGLTGTKTVSSSSSSSYIYGYSFFRQRRDATIRRGYFQKSLVILSHLPYVSLFSEIVAKLGPLYFEHGAPILEAFANAVTKWPNPSPGLTLPLPLFGTVLWTALPLGRQGQSSLSVDSKTASPAVAKKSSAQPLSPQQKQTKPKEAGSSEEDPLLASIPSTPLVEVFKEALQDLWLIWECVLLAEPIIVIAPDPKIASEAVWHLMDVCRPIPQAGDFRPFFTIHDYDFKHLAGRNQPPAGTIIGCTNPFMAQTCAGFSNVLRVGKAAVKMGTAGKYGSKGAGSGRSGPPGGGIAGGQGAGGGGPQHLPGFTTKRKRRISKDRPLLKTLTELVEHPESMGTANAMLRRHLADMTERFLSPLNRYVSSLIPAEGVSDPSKIKPFNTDAFLASLKTHGTPLAIRSRSLPTASTVRQGLYLDFLKCPNFSYYLTERIAYYKTRDPVPTSKKSRFES